MAIHFCIFQIFLHIANIFKYFTKDYQRRCVKWCIRGERTIQTVVISCSAADLKIWCMCGVKDALYKWGLKIFLNTAKKRSIWDSKIISWHYWPVASKMHLSFSRANHFSFPLKSFKGRSTHFPAKNLQKKLSRINTKMSKIQIISD